MLTEVKPLDWRQQTSCRKWLSCLVAIEGLNIVSQYCLKFALAHGLAVGILCQLFRLYLVRFLHFRQRPVLYTLPIHVLGRYAKVVLHLPMAPLPSIIGRLLPLHLLALALLLHATDVVFTSVTRLCP